MIVYRIEHSIQLIGPFYAEGLDDEDGWYGRWRWGYIDAKGKHPSPYHDAETNLASALRKFLCRWKYPVFGVKSIDQAKEWLGDFGSFFKEHNFVLNKYEVDDEWCFVGQTQLIFVRQYAILLDTLQLDTL